MVWKSLLFIFCGVLLQEYISCRNMWSCTPTAPHQFVWISTHAHPVNISSPTAFPSNMSVFCWWKIEAPQGYRIRIHFTSFSLINSVNCTQTAVELSEKRGLLSVILGRYCGIKPPADVVTQESFVLLGYRASNGSHQGHTGFNVTVSLAPAETCSLLNSPEANQNIVLSGSSGVFITPVYPRTYPTNIQCRWTITVPSGHRIELRFLRFDLGSSPQNGDCSKDDFVEVRDSDNKNDPSYGLLCGNAKPSPVLSVGPKMVVTFKSDEKRVFEGFFAKYDAIPEGVCSHNNSIVQLNLTHNATGHFSSPDYPFQFPPIRACYWRIKAPDGHRVKLQFTTMNISGNCEGDINDGEWVRVDDSFIADFNSVTSFWGRFCSSASPPPIYSTRSELQVFFTSNYSINTDSKGLTRLNNGQGRNNGFYATYEVIKQGFTSRCRTDRIQKEPIIVQGKTGTLVSPGYPYSYPLIICTWKIVVPKNYIVEVEFGDFELDCAGGSSLKVGEQNEFCGSKKPDKVLTSDSDLKFNMVIKKAGNYRGFRATFSLRERKPEVASIVPWVIIPIVLVAVGVTLCVVWKRRRNDRDRGSSFRASIINRMRSQSSASH